MRSSPHSSMLKMSDLVRRISSPPTTRKPLGHRRIDARELKDALRILKRQPSPRRRWTDKKEGER